MPNDRVLDDVEAVLGVFVDWLLIANAVIGDGDFLGVLLGSRMTRDDRVVQAIRAHRYGAGPFTFAFSSRTTVASGFFCLALSAAIRPAVPPPITRRRSHLGVVRDIIHGQIPLWSSVDAVRAVPLMRCRSCYQLPGRKKFLYRTASKSMSRSMTRDIRDRAHRKTRR